MPLNKLRNMQNVQTLCLSCFHSEAPQHEGHTWRIRYLPSDFELVQRQLLSWIPPNLLLHVPTPEDRAEALQHQLKAHFQ